MYGNEDTVWARNPVVDMTPAELDELGAWAAAELGLETAGTEDENPEHGANADDEMDHPWH